MNNNDSASRNKSLLDIVNAPQTGKGKTIRRVIAVCYHDGFACVAFITFGE